MFHQPDICTSRWPQCNLVIYNTALFLANKPEPQRKSCCKQKVFMRPLSPLGIFTMHRCRQVPRSDVVVIYAPSWGHRRVDAFAGTRKDRKHIYLYIYMLLNCVYLAWYWIEEYDINDIKLYHKLTTYIAFPCIVFQLNVSNSTV